MNMSHAGETIFFEGDGVRLAARVWGPAEGHPVLFFHGHGQSKHMWAIAAEIVGANSCLGLSVDLRGHGDSEWAPDGDYSVEAYARDILRIIQQLGRRVTIAGASRGGYVGLQAAAWRPNAVRLMMLCDVAPTVRPDSRYEYEPFFRACLRGFESVEEVAEALRKYLHYPVGDPERLRHSLREKDGRLFYRWDPQVSAPQYFEGDTSNLVSDLKGYSSPTVLLRSERGSVLTEQGVRAFQKMVPHLVVEPLPGTRHIFTHADNPIVAARVLHHLRRGVAAPAPRRQAQ
jgi:non-heme chloroperoxidase